jgi:hypothetical protein
MQTEVHVSLLVPCRLTIAGMFTKFNIVLHALHEIQSRHTERLQNIHMLIFLTIVVLCRQVVVCNYFVVEK